MMRAGSPAVHGPVGPPLPQGVLAGVAALALVGRLPAVAIRGFGDTSRR